MSNNKIIDIKGHLFGWAKVFVEGDPSWLEFKVIGQYQGGSYDMRVWQDPFGTFHLALMRQHGLGGYMRSVFSLKADNIDDALYEACIKFIEKLGYKVE